MCIGSSNLLILLRSPRDQRRCNNSDVEIIDSGDVIAIIIISSGVAAAAAAAAVVTTSTGRDSDTLRPKQLGRARDGDLRGSRVTPRVSSRSSISTTSVAQVRVVTRQTCVDFGRIQRRTEIRCRVKFERSEIPVALNFELCLQLVGITVLKWLWFQQFNPGGLAGGRHCERSARAYIAPSEFLPVSLLSVFLCFRYSSARTPTTPPWMFFLLAEISPGAWCIVSAHYVVRLLPMPTSDFEIKATTGEPIVTYFNFNFSLLNNSRTMLKKH